MSKPTKDADSVLFKYQFVILLSFMLPSVCFPNDNVKWTHGDCLNTGKLDSSVSFSLPKLFTRVPKTVITAGFLSLCFIQNEVKKLYRDLLSAEHTPGIQEDTIYLDNTEGITVKNIYDVATSLFPSHGNPVKFLELLESQDPYVRKYALQQLTSHHGLKDYQCREIAQFCSYRTVASLARVQDVDPRLFRRMPPLMNSEIANPLQDTEEQSIDDEDSDQAEDKPEIDKYKDILQELIEDTLTVDNCMKFVNEGGLGFLQQILMKYTTSLEIVPLIAFILANLSVIDELHSKIIQGGWAYVLHQWLKTSDMKLFFHASRALANLDKDWESDIGISALYEDGIYLGHPVYRTGNEEEIIQADIVFIHGLQGGPFKSWREKDKFDSEINNNNGSSINPTIFWPKDWLIPDLSHSVRILNIGYDAATSFWNMQSSTKGERLIETGSSLLNKLKKADIGRRPVIWVGHSMGGLLIKEIMFISETDSKFRDFNRNTIGVIFYSTPHKGSRMASLAKYLFPMRPTQAVKDLVYDNEYLQMLHKSFIFTMLKNNIPCLSIGEGEPMNIGVARYSRKIVESESADPGVGQFVEVPSDHVNTCKPDSKQSLLYKYTLTFIEKCIGDLHKAESITE